MTSRRSETLTVRWHYSAFFLALIIVTSSARVQYVFAFGADLMAAAALVIAVAGSSPASMLTDRGVDVEGRAFAGRPAVVRAPCGCQGASQSLSLDGTHRY